MFASEPSVLDTEASEGSTPVSGCKVRKECESGNSRTR
jgi:hypothetical protein